jgi:deoxycytidylate deaminase
LINGIRQNVGAIHIEAQRIISNGSNESTFSSRSTTGRNDIVTAGRSVSGIEIRFFDDAEIFVIVYVSWVVEHVVSIVGVEASHVTVITQDEA